MLIFLDIHMYLFLVVAVVNQSSHMQSSPSSKNISRGGVVLEDFELPLKYSRKPLSQVEIETIEVSFKFA